VDFFVSLLPFKLERSVINCSQTSNQNWLLQSFPYNLATIIATRQKFQLSIRFKVILPYLLLTIIVAVTGAYVVIHLVSNSLDERLANQLLEAGRVVSDQVAQQEIKHVGAARLVAYTLGLSEALHAGDSDQVRALAAPVAAGSGVESIRVFDDQGLESSHFIRQSNGVILDLTEPGEVANLPFVDELLSENNPDSLPRRGLAKDPEDERYYYYTALPVVYEDRVTGVVIVGTSLNSILPELKDTSLANVILYGEDRRAIASTVGMQEEKGLFQRTISLPKGLYQSVIDSENVVSGENITVDGHSYKIAYGPLQVGENRLGVFAVLLPQNYVLESSRRSRNEYVILYSLATIAAVLLGILIARLIVNPLAKLVRVSRDIANGDLSRRTEIRTRDEIGVLATTFDDMTEHLQQRTLELERSNQLLEQMDRTKTRFIQVSAHELRTPMTIVQGYAQLIEVKAKDHPQFSKYADGILEGTNRMVDIIDNMLDVSRIETNQLGVMPTNVKLDQVLEKVQETFEQAFEQRGIRLTLDGLDSLPAIQGDQDLLYKVFYHVVMNAIKFTPDGGSILVGGYVINEGFEVEVSVRDTGIGIDPQNQELVFEKFYQTGEVLLHSSGKTKFKGGGPGLGLAIARGIVNAHGGHIWIESPGYDEAKNPGTTVFISLPVNGQFNEKK
jgi:signal transduction histidine kinase